MALVQWPSGAPLKSNENSSALTVLDEVRNPFEILGKKACSVPHIIGKFGASRAVQDNQEEVFSSIAKDLCLISVNPT